MAGSGRAPRALFCDTNVLIRLLTDDPLAQAQAAEATLDAAGTGQVMVILTDVVIAELAYVLTSVYELRHHQAADRIRAVVDLPGVHVADPEVVRAALTLWSVRKIDFADAYLAALAASTADAGVLSFDRDFDDVEDVIRIDPSAFLEA